ncbi:hypothetical protein F2P56_012646, partial [Juglans regia]
MVITKGKQSIGHLQNTGTSEHLATMKHIQEEVVSSITANDIKWKQRAKQHWLKHGDKNTQYFHMQVSQRRKINAVKSIEDSQGRCVTKQSEIGEVFTGFFSSLFTTSHPSSVEHCLHAMYTKLDMDMKAWLLNPFTREDINAVVFHMNPLGSPSPDGFPAQLLKKILPQIIAPNQSAFVSGRLISDNTMVAYEIQHSMNSIMKGKKGFMALKLDMSNAYNRVEWKFIEAIMIKMDFPRPNHCNHLFFADDGLLFCQAKHEEIKCVLNILELYEKGSGQVLNKDKSAIFFGKNTPQVTQQQILQLAGVQSTSSFERYLGLRALVGRKKIASFHSLIDRTRTRVTNWRTTFLSAAGKKILPKAVLQAIPTYGWRILQNPTSLVAQILKQKYFNKGDLLEAKLGTRPSFAWRGIHAGLTLLKKGLIWRVGNGHKINIWQDRWIPSLPAQKILTPREVDFLCDKSKVDTFSAKKWKESKKGESSGKKRDFQVWRTIWKLKVPPTTKVFLWRACSEALPTLDNLKRRKVVEDSLCLICNQEPETFGHALWGCIGAKDVWCQGPKKVQKLSLQSDLIFNVWAGLVGTLDPVELDEVAVTMRETGLNSNPLARAHRWTQPAVGILKVNWDAAVQSREGRIGIGVLIRDHQGLVIGALRANRILRGNPFVAEAYGLLMATFFCKDLGLRQLCLEGDSKQVVDLLNQDSSNWSMGGCLITDAKTILNSVAA